MPLALLPATRVMLLSEFHGRAKCIKSPARSGRVLAAGVTTHTQQMYNLPPTFFGEVQVCWGIKTLLNLYF